MRELTYYVACSVDGFIAHHDGSHNGFVQDDEYIADLVKTFPETFPAHWRDTMNIQADNKWFDIVLMGRKTYEIGLNAGLTNPYPHLKQYVFSRTMKASPDEDIKIVSKDAVTLVQTLKNETGKGIWLCGGGNLATMLFAENLVDKLILKVNPFLMGSGIPLFSGVIQQTALELTNHKIYDNGVLLSHYRILKSH